MQVVPTILTDDLVLAKRQFNWIHSQGIERIQLDVMDGLLTEGTTAGVVNLLEIVSESDGNETTIDLHLMTEEPAEVVREIEEEIGLDAVKIGTLIAQIERLDSWEWLTEEAARANWGVGMSLDLYTPTEEIDLPWLHNQRLKVVQLMGVEMGKQGQVMAKKEVLAKIAEVKNLIQQTGRGKEVEIWVDGGVKIELLSELRQAGVTGVGVGSGIWQGDNEAVWDENWTRLQAAISND